MGEGGPHKDGCEPPSAPVQPNYTASGGPGPSNIVTGYPVVYPSQHAQPAAPVGAYYPTVPHEGSGASFAPPAVPNTSNSASAPLLAPAPTTVIICRETHRHICGEVSCGTCHRTSVPEARTEAGLCSCITAVGLCASGCWPCAWLPFCCSSTQDTVYRCRHCGAEVYRRRAPFE